MNSRSLVYLGAGVAVVLLLAGLHIALGTVRLTPVEVVRALLNDPVEPFHRQVIWDLRVPRTLIAAMAGAQLGLAGAILQTALRNPLAEPSLTGISAGAILAAVLWLSLGTGLEQPGRVVPLIAMAGGLAALALVLAASRSAGGSLRLILNGVIVTSILGGATAIVLVIDGSALGGVLSWMIGSLNGRVWVHWNTVWPWAFGALFLGLISMRAANVLQMGEEIARGLGLHPGRWRGILVGIAALNTATAVAVVGAVSFVGLIASHIARLLVGQDARRLFPMAVLCGASLLLAADTISQTVVFNLPWRGLSPPAQLPAGVLLSLLGAVFFLYLLRREAVR